MRFLSDHKKFLAMSIVLCSLTH